MRGELFPRRWLKEVAFPMYGLCVTHTPRGGRVPRRGGVPGPRRQVTWPQKGKLALRESLHGRPTTGMAGVGESAPRGQTACPANEVGRAVEGTHQLYGAKQFRQGKWEGQHKRVAGNVEASDEGCQHHGDQQPSWPHPFCTNPLLPAREASQVLWA